ncbi:hypothetical protein BST44_23480 [Mycobacterium scrofulaceum]|uniref:Sulfotransferase family protein n=2 Tax=Mycobacterium scrofulaceum TaxID=1783 RepID=A0A1X0K5N3_MYCSC|nr:hypothetical protein BST44_23480 [Mycobacterium scrofulaceum]
MTMVTQFLNHHADIVVFDEIDLLSAGRYGDSAIGTLRAFLLERGLDESFRRDVRNAADPALALRRVIGGIVGPGVIWGEKNPRYATRLPELRRSYPEAAVLFVVRDPRDVVNSCLSHRESPYRTPLDFWIKDTVAEALTLVQSSLEPLQAGDPELAVLRYEAFAAAPKTALDAALGHWGLTFSDDAVALAHPVPESVGDHQFFRGGAALPWKVGNMSPLRQSPSARDRVDAGDPVWKEVDALARRIGYH